MKFLMILTVVVFSLPSFAERICKARRGYEAHQSFCRGLEPFACAAHNSICRSVIRPEPEGGCYARKGYEGHESFCNNLSEFACNAHSICRWYDGWDD